MSLFSSLAVVQLGLERLCVCRALGVKSLLVERHATTAVHPQAHVVNMRTMELFRNWGSLKVVAAAYPMHLAPPIALAVPTADMSGITDEDRVVIDAYMERDGITLCCRYGGTPGLVRSGCS